MPKYTTDQLSRFIDHTDLHAAATIEDMQNLCEEAKRYHFRMVAVNQAQTELCSKLLAGTDISTGAAISFPLGQTTIKSKVYETKDAIKNGANEIDYVINITELKAKRYDYIAAEMAQMVSVCHSRNVLCKVIFENSYLKKSEIRTLAEIAVSIKPDYIKTSTGFASGVKTIGATLEDVRLMKLVVGDVVKVKAAGGIRDAETFLAMIAAGADRIGTSSGVAIMKDIEKSLVTSGGYVLLPAKDEQSI